MPESFNKNFVFIIIYYDVSMKKTFYIENKTNTLKGNETKKI